MTQVNAVSQFVWQCFLDSLPGPVPRSVCEWAERNVRLVGSSFGDAFIRDTMPWLVEPLECAGNGTRSMTFIKPIQSGGSTVGEISLLFWMAHWTAGNIGYFWPNDAKADQRWLIQTEKIFKACKPLMDKVPEDRFKWMKGMIVFPHLNFLQLGARTDRNVASTPFRGIVNEELHDVQGGWEPGKLEQVYGRTTAFWNSVVFNISNASQTGDQLHQAFTAGTMQYWTVKCPGCGLYHRMRTRWEDEKPELGGLRYNADGCRLPNEEYDYNKLAPTIYFQMPCGHKVNDNVTERRALSLSGVYSEPTNKGAQLVDRSYTIEGVAIDHVPWLKIIQQKHSAWRALKRGDPEPWDIYRRERECIFSSIDDRPRTRTITLSKAKKNREGMPNREMRYALVDRQKGSTEKGELPHWWMVIMDWDVEGNALVVWEGKCLTDQDVITTINEHKVRPLCVTVDSGWDSQNVYAFCFRNGYSCIKVEGRDDSGAPRTFSHKDDSRRIYSEPEPLHQMLGQPPTRDKAEEEPMFFHVSKFGAMERLLYIMARKDRKFEIPIDVSEDFTNHMDAWEQTSYRHSRTNQLMPSWKQKRDRDDLYQCCCYGVVCAEMDGLIGMVTEPPPQDQQAQAA